MSLHLAASAGEIAATVLMPGDPLRAKYVAEKYLENCHCYSQVRGMYGFTGIFQGKKVSIQGSGMGMPSFSIYAQELITDYQVKRIIRIGSCGSFLPQVHLRDIILALGASTDSNMNNMVFGGANFTPTANFELLVAAYQKAKQLQIKVHVGNVLSTDIFYAGRPDYWDRWREYGILGVEMETAALYTLAARFGIEALSILTVSDSFVTSEHCSAQEREKNFEQMVDLAFGLV